MLHFSRISIAEKGGSNIMIAVASLNRADCGYRLQRGHKKECRRCRSRRGIHILPRSGKMRHRNQCLKSRDRKLADERILYRSRHHIPLWYRHLYRSVPDLWLRLPRSVLHIIRINMKIRRFPFWNPADLFCSYFESLVSYTVIPSEVPFTTAEFSLMSSAPAFNVT